MTVNGRCYSLGYLIGDKKDGIISLFKFFFSQQAFQQCGEEITIDAFIKLTSSDCLGCPRKGIELWEYLKERFPSEQGGIDVKEIGRQMAQIIVNEVAA